MNRRSGSFRAFALLSLVVVIGAGCVTWAPVNEPLPEVVMRTQHLRVTTVDDVRFQIEGNESAAIRVVDGVLMGPIGSGTVSLPLTDIAQVEVPERSGRRTAFFAGGVVAGIGLLLLLMTRAEVGQAPIIP